MAKDSLQIVLDVSRALAEGKGIRSNLTGVLGVFAEQLRTKRSFILLYETDTERLSPVAVNGFSVNEYRRLEARVHKSVMQKIFEAEKPIVIGRIDAEPSLDFLAGEEDRTLFTVPVLRGKKSLGVLATEFVRRDDFEPDQLLTLLSLTASMIAQTMKSAGAESDETQKLLEENTHLRQELKEKHEFSHIIGNSSVMRQVYDQVTQVAKSNTAVLLRGESGTGKEMIANAIHYNSLRSKKPLVKVNCAALPETQIEAELFGYEKGAFTGADRAKKGRFEMADGGTLFLDEIGDLPPQTQIKLLRVLHEREFERLGGAETIKINVRLIAATNRNLEEAIAEGKFREDLFYRLNVFTIFLPPLRERKSDILLLAEHFLEKYEVEHGKRIRRISTPAIDMLTAYHYPGNVRELENAVERAVLVCDANVIHGHHLPPTLQTAEVSGTVTRASLTAAVEAFERGLIADSLKTTRGNVAKAAKMLDSTERILGYKIKKYGIDTMRFRR